MENDHVQEGYGIRTARLHLICCAREILEVIFTGDAALAGHLHINIPPHWTEFGEQAFRYTYDKIVTQRMQPQWWSYLPILNKTNTLIGTCGYKGAPRNGIVEIGYEVAPAFRGWGLATEMAKGLVENAFKHDEVDLVQAHTLAVENESCSVLKKCRMHRVEEIDDPEDGRIWRWEISKLDF